MDSNLTWKNHIKEVENKASKSVDINECLDASDDICTANAECINTQGSYHCTCNDGYEEDGSVCSDIDECSSNSISCHEKGYCKNSIGSYSCECRTGYFKVDEETCTDINECKTATKVCDTNADCTNTEGSYTCTCKSGYTQNETICSDINECDLTHDCHKNANCSNTPGGFTCTCKEGYEGDGKICNKISICKTKECPAYSTCYEDSGDCICNDGFYYQDEGCIDYDECSGNSTLCGYVATCHNVPGSFECICNAGYMKDDDQCIDIDECYLDISNCSQKCENQVPGYFCSCSDGFELQPDNTCNVPEKNETCDKECGSEGLCYFLNDTEACYCNKGFMIDPSNETCIDIDECEPNDHANHTCDMTCTNEEGGYACSCYPGYRLDTTNRRTCSDIDECLDGTNNCSSNSVCTNTAGGFNCTCLAGFTGDGYGCLDINECDNSQCDNVNNSVCVNTNGSYECECNAGFIQSGNECADMDECNSVDICGDYSVCENIPGNYTCNCEPGYGKIDAEGKNCTDIDECDELPCHSNASCENTAGSFVCICNEGFYGNGSYCKNYDECSRSPGPCGEHAKCIDTVGSYLCNCTTGYQKNENDTCIDTNECEQGSSCPENSNCNNTMGSFYCTCKEGYDGYDANNATSKCENINECAFDTLNDCDDYANCTDIDGSYTCGCKDGFNGDGTYCVDVDECKDNNHCNATIFEKCDNTIGSYMCICQTGYYRHNANLPCTVVVTQELSVNFTDVKGNKVGSAKIDNEDTIKSGLAKDVLDLYNRSIERDQYLDTQVLSYVLYNSVVDVTFRIDLISETSLTLNETRLLFLNGLTGKDYNILLPNSYVVRSSLIVDEPVINPCNEDTDDCLERNYLICVFEGHAKYSCADCKEGYTDVGNNTICEDEDECRADNLCDLKESVCVNEDGSYYCSCNVGYVYQSRHTCTEVKTFRTESTLKDAVWKDALSNNSSDEYKELSKNLSISIDKTFKNETTYEGNEVLGFKEGSVIGIYTVYFDVSSSIDEDDVILYLNKSEDLISNTATELNVTDPCSGVDCENNGTCVADANDDFVKICHCMDGFSGTYCEEKNVTNSCSGVVCQNGGTCYPTEDDNFFCNCTNGFNGTYCETEEKDEEEDESLGIIVAFIVLASLLAAILAALIIYYLIVRKREYSRKRTSSSSYDNDFAEFDDASSTADWEYRSTSGSDNIHIVGAIDHERMQHLAEVVGKMRKSEHLNEHVRARSLIEYSGTTKMPITDFFRRTTIPEQTVRTEDPEAYSRALRSVKIPRAGLGDDEHVQTTHTNLTHNYL
ncbi:uncharacterized protein [Antedon mediterranea]|uniref:uncharacterized protein n=1 Tax=Antedon mediterranea TaxID=105859 RepID=UPI003AF4144B